MGQRRGFSAAEAPLAARLFINRLNEPTGVVTDESATRLGNLLGIFRDVQAGDCDGDGDADLIGVSALPDYLIRNDMPSAWTDISTLISPNIIGASDFRVGVGAALSASGEGRRERPNAG